MDKNKYLTNELSKKLYEKLIPLRDWDSEFALCILAILRTDKNKEKLLNLIDKGLNNSDQIILKALAIRDNK